MYYVEHPRITSTCHRRASIGTLGNIFNAECSGHNDLFPIRYPVKNRSPPLSRRLLPV